MAPTDVTSEELVVVHQLAIEATMRRVCKRWFVKGAAAEDLVQEFWLVVLQCNAQVLRRHQGRSAMSTYLFTVLMRRAHRWFAGLGSRRRREKPAGDTYELYGPILVDERPWNRDASESQDGLKRAIASLQSGERLLLRLRFSEGQRVAEIAATLGVTPKAIERRLARVSGRLRLTLGGTLVRRPKPITSASRSTGVRTRQKG